MHNYKHCFPKKSFWIKRNLEPFNTRSTNGEKKSIRHKSLAVDKKSLNCY